MNESPGGLPRPLHRPAMHGTVFQDWFSKNGWKMQSIFVNGLRAPDVKTSGVKKWVRWMRTQTCHNADPHKPDCYMSAPKVSEELLQQALDELEYLTCHYVHHFADANRIIALFHPNQETRQWADRMHYQIADEIFHFKPETDDEFLDRHRDKVTEDYDINELEPHMREYWLRKVGMPGSSA